MTNRCVRNWRPGSMGTSGDDNGILVLFRLRAPSPQVRRQECRRGTALSGLPGQDRQWPSGGLPRLGEPARPHLAGYPLVLARGMVRCPSAPGRSRCAPGGRFPDQVRVLALELVCHLREHLRHNGVTFDEGYGRNPAFLSGLEERGERYIGEVPKTPVVGCSDPLVQTPVAAGGAGPPRFAKHAGGRGTTAANGRGACRRLAGIGLEASANPHRF